MSHRYYPGNTISSIPAFYMTLTYKKASTPPPSTFISAITSLPLVSTVIWGVV
jgi:hypothetical protein